MKDKKFEYRRACKCGNVDYIPVNKREAAFCLRENEIWNQKYSKCGGTKCVSLGQNPPEIDKSLLLEWALDPELYFLEQDEDLILAEEKYLELILDVIDNYEVLEEKKNTLISSLCVLVYDNSEENKKDVDGSLININKNLAIKTLTELKKRKQHVINADGWIMDYVKKLVYPKLGIKLNRF